MDDVKMSKMIPVRTECWKTFCSNKWTKFTQARKINTTGIKIIKVCHLLRIRNRMLHKRYTRLWSICWIRNCYIRNCSTNRRVNADWGFETPQRFQNQKFYCFKRKGLVLATWDELCDEIERFVTGWELTHAGSDG